MLQHVQLAQGGQLAQPGLIFHRFLDFLGLLVVLGDLVRPVFLFRLGVLVGLGVQLLRPFLVGLVVDCLGYVCLVLPCLRVVRGRPMVLEVPVCLEVRVGRVFLGLRVPLVLLDILWVPCLLRFLVVLVDLVDIHGHMAVGH